MVDDLGNNVKNISVTIWQNRKYRGILLFFLVLFFLAYTGMRYFCYVAQSDPDFQIRRVVICLKCGARETTELDSIDQVRCKKCGSAMGYGWKCRSCDYEFPVTKNVFSGKLDNERLLLREQMCACPNCRSEKTVPMQAK